MATHKSKTHKTTVYLNADEYRRLKKLARGRRTTPAALLRQAVAEFNAQHGPRPYPKSIGRFSSGMSDLSERAEELLFGGTTRR